MIDFECSNCNRRARVADKYGGKRVRCRGCGQGTQVSSGPGGSVQDKPEKIKFACEHCGQKFGVGVKYAGRRVKFKKSGQAITVPAVGNKPVQEGAAVAAPVAADDVLRVRPLEPEGGALEGGGGVGVDAQAAYYKHSGGFSPAGLVLMPLFGLVAAVVLGFVYASADGEFSSC